MGVVDTNAALADIFNKYDGVKFQNATIRHGPDGPPTPYQPIGGMNPIVIVHRNLIQMILPDQEEMGDGF